ncbi:MAG TPA: hypothetical protein VGR45_10600 [Stellaceae bacterium]|nr:hypothetical protein [Stellaceae bacterium]
MNGRLLVAYSNSSNYVSTTAEYLDAIARHSSWDVRYVHVTQGAQIDFDLNEFDAVFNSYCARLIHDGYVSADYISQLRSFRGVKLLAVQDEYERTDRLKAAITDIGFHAVLTCVPNGTIERVYPRAAFPRTEFIKVLTGYVPEHLARRGRRAMPLRERPIHIGYRGRGIGGHYGRLGFLKFEIGRRMREICETRAIPHDIEWSEAKRLYGEAWYDFIASCRATLGSESGSNVFDFDGSIEETYQRLSAERGGPVPYQQFRAYTDPIERQYDMAQISPRVFEAAALRTPLVLFSGRYSGLIEPDTHYIELKEDFSNVDTVLARLGDLAGLASMADRAHRHLIASGEYGYPRFVGLVDELLERKAAEIGLSLRSAPERLPQTEGGVGADPTALQSLEERPTAKPRHFVFYQYKHAAREQARLNEQTALLTAEVARLNERYPAMIADCNAEITRLRTEVARLNKHYPAMIADLNAEITRLRTDIGRLTGVHQGLQSV